MAFTIGNNCDGCGACVAFCPVGAISGVRNEKHKVDTQRCIECGVCGKVCPRGSLCDAFGMVCVPLKRSLWQKPVCQYDRCVSCGLCVSACPTGVLTLSREEGSVGKRRVPILAPKGCIACGFCADACPFEALWLG